MWLLPGKPMGVASDPSLKSLRFCQGTFAQPWLLWGRFLGKKNKDCTGYCPALTGNWMPYGRIKSPTLTVHIFSRARGTVLVCYFKKKKKQNWQYCLGDCDFSVCSPHPVLAGPSHVRLSNTLCCCFSNAIHLWELKRNPIILTQPLTNTEYRVTGRE